MALVVAEFDMRVRDVKLDIPGITTDIEDSTLTVTAGDYKLVIKKKFHRWYFREDLSSKPTMMEHFALRKQVHYALNPQGNG